VSNKPDDDDVLLGSHKSERSVPYSDKPVRDVAQVYCKQCMELDGKHAKFCKKNN